jgi:hypothetical protein
MIQLSEQQQREIREAGWPPRATDPRTGEVFVLIHQEMFERVRTMLERQDEIADIEEMYPLSTEAIDADVP